MVKNSIKVLIVDDSALIREFLRKTLDAQPDIEVVASASDPYYARDKFLKERPDVITLDIEMPRMDGLTFLNKLMASHPTPVVMISSLTQKGAKATIKALNLGAVDFVAKPPHLSGGAMDDLANEIVSKVRNAAKAKLRKSRLKVEQLDVPAKVEVDRVVALSGRPPRPGGPMLLLIGASTGGTVALEKILTRLPADSPPIAIVQHMPRHFTKAFADRLNGLTEITISEAKDRQPIPPGHAVIAPGDWHMLVEKDHNKYIARIKKGPRVNRHRPSVDVLFRSGVNAAGPNATAVILTGMGDDGAKGMKDLHDAGAYTIGQNQSTCTIYGMPRAAKVIGAVDRELKLTDIAPMVMGLWEQAQK